MALYHHLMAISLKFRGLNKGANLDQSEQNSCQSSGNNTAAIGCTLEIALSLRVRKEKPIKLSKIFNYLFLITQAMHGYVQVVKNSHNTCKIKVFPKQRILSSSGSHLSDHSSVVDQF